MFLVYGPLRAIRGLAGVVLWIEALQVFLVGAIRFFNAVSMTTPQPVSLAEPPESNLLINVVLVLIFGTIFHVLRLLINKIHLMHRGVPHPKMIDEWQV